MTHEGRVGGDRRADDRAAVRADGDVGAVPAGRLLRGARRAGSGAQRAHAGTDCWRLVIVAAGALSAVLANDIVCLAMAPVRHRDLRAARRLDPVPYPARARLRLERRLRRHADRQPAEHADRPDARLVVRPLSARRRRAGARRTRPSSGSSSASWLYRGRWTRETPMPDVADAPPVRSLADDQGRGRDQRGDRVLFLVSRRGRARSSRWPAPACCWSAGSMASRELHRARRLAAAASSSSGSSSSTRRCAQSGLRERPADDARAAPASTSTQPAALFGATAVLSNIVSNVPAVMLLLPAARHDLAGTDAGARLDARRQPARSSAASPTSSWSIRPRGSASASTARTHARVGVPVGVATLAIAALWLSLPRASDSSATAVHLTHSIGAEA